jgi:serpin B
MPSPPPKLAGRWLMFGKSKDESAVASTWSATLATALYRQLSARPGNFAFSPWSISVALAMLQPGADGETRREIEAALGHRGAGDALLDLFAGLVAELSGCARTDPKAIEFWLASALWCQVGYPVHPEFVEVLRGRLGAEIREADFAQGRAEAVQRVNEWVAEATRQRIPVILSEPPFDPLTRVLLANACYFNAPWGSPFDEELTRPEPFRLSDGTRVQVPTMHESSHYRYARLGDVQALELLYRARRFAMVILLPDEGELESVQRKTGAEEIRLLIAAMTSQEMRLSLPRFRVRSGLSLRSPLEAIGVKTAFGPGADFSGISTEPGFALGDVVHGTFVNVDERGTEAAAATVADATFGAALSPPKPIEFRVDRPFVFVLRDRLTGTLLFMGRVVDPREQEATISSPI